MGGMVTFEELGTASAVVGVVVVDGEFRIGSVCVELRRFLSLFLIDLELFLLRRLLVLPPPPKL